MAVQWVTTLRAAEAAREKQKFDIVILDIMLPDGRGDELLGRWQMAAPLPVIVLSARTDPKTRIAVFNAGAIDYVPKPFWMEEIIHRIRLRVGAPAAERWQLGELTVDGDAGQVWRGEEEVALSPTERTILLALLRQAGKVVSRRKLSELLEDGFADGPTERAVDSYLARLRKKLGPEAGARIRTVMGMGYRLDLEQP